MKKLIWIFALILCSCQTPQQVADQKSSSKMDSKGVRKTILSHRKYIGNCYGKTLTQKGSEHLKGAVMVNFVIGPDGKAHSARIIEEQSTIKSKALNDCLLAGLTSWDFPVHPDGKDVTINYPFVFRANPPANMQQKLDQFQKLRRTQ